MYLRVLTDVPYTALDTSKKKCNQYMLDTIPDYVWLIKVIQGYEVHLKAATNDLYFYALKSSRDAYLYYLDNYHFVMGNHAANLLYAHALDMAILDRCLQCNEVRLLTQTYISLEMQYLTFASRVREYLHDHKQHNAMTNYMRITTLKDRLFQVFFFTYAFEITTSSLGYFNADYIADKGYVAAIYDRVAAHKERLRKTRSDMRWHTDIWYP